MLKLLKTLLLVVWISVPSSSSETASSSIVYSTPPEVIHESTARLRAQEYFNPSSGLVYIASIEAAKVAVPESIVFAMIYVESNWRVGCINRNRNGTEDRGLMQLNSSNQEYFTWKFNNSVEFNADDVVDNIRIGCAYLKHLYKQFGSWNAAVTAYNCGPGAYRAGRVPTASKRYAISVFKWRELLESKIVGVVRNARD